MAYKTDLRQAIDAVEAIRDVYLPSGATDFLVVSRYNGHDDYQVSHVNSKDEAMNDPTASSMSGKMWSSPASSHAPSTLAPCRKFSLDTSSLARLSRAPAPASALGAPRTLIERFFHAGRHRDLRETRRDRRLRP